MNALATLILVVACFNAYVYGESHLVCKKMDEVFSSHLEPTGPTHSYRNRPGKRGVEGRKGEIGRTGQKGDQGIVRYDLVNKTLKEYISEYEREQDRRILDLEASLATINEKLTAISLQGCPIPYNNKCYVPKTDIKRNIATGRDICAGIFGKLANLYDKSQMDYLIKTLRNYHMVGSGSVTDFWTGMTINPQNGEVKLSDGRPATYLRWDDGYPMTTSSRTNIILRVHKSPSSTDQYMWNYEPSYNVYILCEI